METHQQTRALEYRLTSRAFLTRALVGVVRGYQYAISPLLGCHCRFIPTCSEYAVQALQQHGAVKGSVLSLRRLCCCHPWHTGGFDPVPQNFACKIKDD